MLLKPVGEDKTMMTDTIADMLTRVRNALMMKQEQTSVPHSKLKEAIAKILEKEGFINGFEVLGEKIKKSLVIQLKYLPDGSSVISNLQRVSRLSRRVFLGHEDLKSFRSGLGVRILTTSKGIMSDQEAKEKKMGGEILLEVW